MNVSIPWIETPFINKRSLLHIYNPPNLFQKPNINLFFFHFGMTETSLEMVVTLVLLNKI